MHAVIGLILKKSPMRPAETRLKLLLATPLTASKATAGSR